MDDTKQPLTNPELLQAIARMKTENSRESREAVLDLVISTARFLAPVSITPPPQEQGGGQAVLGRDTAIQFQLIANQENQPFFPAFTSWDELRRLCGPQNQQTLVLTFDDYAGMVLGDNRAAGFVVDPFGACLSFDRTMMEHLVRRREQQSQA